MFIMDAFVNLSTVQVLLTIVSVMIVGTFWSRNKRNLPPGPFAWPVIGNLLMFRKDPQGHKKFTRMSERYGKVYRLYCGSVLVVILNGYDAIHEAFTRQADVFTDRPQLFAPLIGVTKGTGLTYNSGHPWKALRRFTLQALRDFGVGKLTLEERIKEEISVMTQMLHSANSEPIRVKPILLSAATNIICSVMFGARFDYSEAKFVTLNQVLEEIFRINAPFAKENFFPLTRNFPSGKELISRRSAAMERVKNYLAETIREHEKYFDPSDIRDFIDLYLKTAREGATDAELFTEANIYKIIIDLFVAGGETTGTSLDWSLLYMISFPEVQTKCRQEIRKVVGSGRTVGLSDRGKLPYVEATLQEIQRIANTLPFSIAHISNEDTKVEGYDIPKDSIVIANLYSAHMDPLYWEQPEQFKPERFLSESGKEVRRPAMVPFGDGPRLCIGEPLARMELFLFFTNLLQEFTFSTDPGVSEKPTLEGVQALTLTPLPYKLVATPCL